MKKYFNRIFLTLVTATALPMCLAQSTPGAVNATATPSEDAVKSGDEFAIFATGNLGERKYIPMLTKLAKKGNHLTNGPARYAQMALAKLGEQQQLAEISCEAREGDDVLRLDILTNKVPYVGGMFAIEEYKRLLTNSPANTHALSSSDEVGPTPMWIAVSSLSLVVPAISGQQTPKISGLTPQQSARSWQDWLEKNEHILANIKPNAIAKPTRKTSCHRYLKNRVRRPLS